jgi:hypothetical protein
VVSEETRHTSLVERGRVLRSLDEDRLRTALLALLRPPDPRGRAANSVAAFSRSPFSQARRLPGVPPRRGDPTSAAAKAAATAGTPAAAVATVAVNRTPGAPAAPVAQNPAPAVPGPAGRVE